MYCLLTTMTLRQRIVLVFLSIIAVVCALSISGCAENDVNRGAWLHDEENGMWFQDVELGEAPIEYGEAVRAREKHESELWALSGCNKVGGGQHPNGSHAIVIGFRSQEHLDEAMELDLISPLKDGVPVVISDVVGEIELE